MKKMMVNSTEQENCCTCQNATTVKLNSSANHGMISTQPHAELASSLLAKFPNINVPWCNIENYKQCCLLTHISASVYICHIQSNCMVVGLKYFLHLSQGNTREIITTLDSDILGLVSGLVFEVSVNGQC